MSAEANQDDASNERHRNPSAAAMRMIENKTSTTGSPIRPYSSSRGTSTKKNTKDSSKNSE
jgi:hypothetical protein